MDKKSLRAGFAKDWKTHYALDIFKEEGFRRQTCKNCGKNFWSLEEREFCSDPPCEEYGFLGRPLKKQDYIKTWKDFEGFFSKKGHASVPRYPVICRWRDDLYFTIASIVDFQRVEDGRLTFEPPAERLVVPQICLRFNDIPNVGVTGRHSTCFQMSGQHSFGYPGTGYWKDDCIRYNYEYCTKILGIPPEELVFNEDVWAMPDLSAFGPSIETFSRGLELVNSVFMQFTRAGDSYKELPMKVIDVGWGHERLVWFANGTPTSYDAIFGDVMDRMKKIANVDYDPQFFLKYARMAGALNMDEVRDLKAERAKIARKLNVTSSELMEKTEPMHALYAIADHAKCLAFAIADGGLPSNAGGGYNLRAVLRRALGFIDRYSFDFTFSDVCEWHARYLKPVFPELVQHLDEISEIIEVEERKHRAALDRSRRQVTALLAKTKKFDEKTLTQLYESQGITPELIMEQAKQQNASVEIPADFYTKMTDRHLAPPAPAAKKEEIDVAGIAETRKMYYSDTMEFDARVVKSFQKDKRFFAILDQTAFYPEGGGQDSDRGRIGKSKVLAVRGIGKVIVHETDSLVSGGKVSCVVDKKRRDTLKRHHTATHLVNGACRRILGEHVWQAGAEKRVDKARLDITHYDALTDGQVREIEDLANKVIDEKRPVTHSVLPRGEAEAKYGFRLYQGGAVPGKEIRVIDVQDWDVEACGGTHCMNTGEVLAVKILKTEKIQDGVIRLEFVAGDIVDEVLREKAEILRKAAQALNVDDAKVPDVVQKIIKENKEKANLVDNLEAMLADGIVSRISPKEKVVEYLPNAGMTLLEKVGRMLVEKNPKSACLLVSEGTVFAVKGRGSSVNIGADAKEAAKIMGGSAGGADPEWKGGGPMREKAKEIPKKIK